MSQRCDVWVITRSINRKPIEDALGERASSNIHWVYFDLPRWMSFWKRGQRGVYLYYYLWQIGAYWVGRRLCREVSFDLVHHVTFASFWNPSFFSMLGLPFIWGPIGAGLAAPRTFWKEFSFRGKLNEWLREVILLGARIDPFRLITEDKAALILAVSSATADQFAARNQKKVALFSAVGYDSAEFLELDPSPSANRGNFIVLSVGRLVHWKGFALAIKAFAKFRAENPDSQHWIVGGGPEKSKLVSLVNSLGIADSVHFIGGLSRQQYLARLRSSDVLFYPSLHQPGAFVIVEAMAARKPVVCLDLGEPALLVTQDTGIKVPAQSPVQVVNDAAIALSKLARNPDLRIQMGAAGRQRVIGHFLWETKGAAMLKYYERVTDRK